MADDFEYYRIDPEKAPRMFEGWQALLACLEEGAVMGKRDLVENVQQSTDLSIRTSRNICAEARKRGYTEELEGARVRLTDKGRELLMEIGTGVEDEELSVNSVRPGSPR